MNINNVECQKIKHSVWQTVLSIQCLLCQVSESTLTLNNMGKKLAADSWKPSQYGITSCRLITQTKIIIINIIIIITAPFHHSIAKPDVKSNCEHFELIWTTQKNPPFAVPENSTDHTKWAR